MSRKVEGLGVPVIPSWGDTTAAVIVKGCSSFFGRIWTFLKDCSLFLIRQAERIGKVFSSNVCVQVIEECHGIKNGGNTCYAAALLQALQTVSVQWDITSKIGEKTSALCLSTLKRTVSGEEIGNLVKEWNHQGLPYKPFQEGDSVTLLEFLEKYMHVPKWKKTTCHGEEKEESAFLTESIRNLSKKDPLETMLKRYTPLEETSFFVLSLHGRKGSSSMESGSKRAVDAPLLLSLKNQAFSLKSVVIYEEDIPHYYTLSPVIRDGKVEKVLVMNDADVSYKPPSFYSQVSKKAVMFFYEKTN